MKTYGYVRVSTEYQDHDSQKVAIEKRHKIDEWYEDRGTGKVTQPNLLKLLNKCKTTDRVIVYAFDRIGRNTRQVLDVMSLFKSKGISVLSMREGFDINSAQGNMLFQIMCSVAEFELSVVSDRVKAGLEAARKRGKVLGAPLVKEEIIKEARILRAKGLSLKKVKKELDARNIKISSGSLHKYLC